MKLTRGIIYKVEIQFPPGPAHLLHLQVVHSLHSVWPTNPEGDFAADNTVISFDDEYPLSEPPYILTAYTWNEDDTYEHRVLIRIGLKAREVVLVQKAKSYRESWRVIP
jgi:hypothetical protein